MRWGDEHHLGSLSWLAKMGGNVTWLLRLPWLSGLLLGTNDFISEGNYLQNGQKQNTLE